LIQEVNHGGNELVKVVIKEKHYRTDTCTVKDRSKSSYIPQFLTHGP